MQSPSAIDAHILLGDEPLEWRLDCLADIDDLPVRLHTCSAIDMDVAKARKTGWSQGSAPYLTWFDPDDRYPPCAADFLREADIMMDTHHDLACVYSCEQRVDSDLKFMGDPDRRPHSFERAIIRPSGVHGLVVVRRELVQKYADRITDGDPTPEFRLIQSIALNGWKFVRLPYLARLWRQHKNQAHLKQHLPPVLKVHG